MPQEPDINQLIETYKSAQLQKASARVVIFVFFVFILGIFLGTLWNTLECVTIKDTYRHNSAYEMHVDCAANYPSILEMPTVKHIPYFIDLLLYGKDH